MKKVIEKIKVEIIKKSGDFWYKKGEIHEVLNEIVFAFSDPDEPHFQKGEGKFGILVADCKILAPVEDFRPVPDFVYGQEVEHKFTKERGKFLCMNGKYAWVDWVGNSSPLTYELQHIRPIQSIRDRVVKILYKYDMPHEAIADRIIEIVKNEKI